MGPIDIRLINTILSGCEYSIESSDNVFIIVNQKWLSTNESLTAPNYGILIPIEQGSACNFSIKFPTDDQPEYRIIIYNQDENNQDEEIVLAFNHIYTIGNVKLVAKLADQPWQYQLPQDADESNFIGNQELDKKKSFFDRLTKKYLPCLLFIIIFLSLVFFAWYCYTEPARRARNVSQIFQADENIHVSLGSDDNVYVFAKNNKGMRIIYEMLKEHPLEESNSIKVKNIVSEKNDIAVWLTKNWSEIKWNFIDLENVERPIIFLSQQRVKPFTAESKKRFLTELKAKLPYIQDVAFSYLDDQVLVNQAKYGLEQLHLHYQQEINPFYNAFIIQGELDDSDLLRLKQFISDFNQKWGDNYIKFIVTLHRDFLKNYSFKNSEQNYIKLTNNHWYIKM